MNDLLTSPKPASPDVVVRNECFQLKSPALPATVDVSRFAPPGGVEEVHLLPYHRIAGSKYTRLKLKQPLEHVKEPDQTFMEELSERFRTTGLKISIGG